MEQAGDARVAKRQETIMRTILSAVLAMSVLTGFVAKAYAFDSKTFWQQQDSEHY
jgi:hypothetical protein